MDVNQQQRNSHGTEKQFIILLDTDGICAFYLATMAVELNFSVEHCWNYTEGEKQKYTERKPCIITTLSTTNSTQTGLESNFGQSDERPATNRLGHFRAWTLENICIGQCAR